MGIDKDKGLERNALGVACPRPAARDVSRPPLLVVEIQSPSTALFDLNTKKAVYERFSIASYRVVIPDVYQPELIAFELRDGLYEQVAHVTGAKRFRAGRPFAVEVIPASPVADLLPSGGRRSDCGGGHLKRATAVRLRWWAP